MDATTERNQSLESATSALNWGIISLILSVFCCGALSLFTVVSSLIGIKKGKKALNEYDLNPDFYHETERKRANSGYILSIIAMIISSLAVLGIIVWVVVLGAAYIMDPFEIFDNVRSETAL